MLRFLLIRQRCSLQTKAASYIVVAVLCFSSFLFGRDCSATTGRIFTKFSPKDVYVYAVLFVNCGTP